MYLIVTRSFPPELGGMQSLMWGLARELSKNFMIKVFADYIENHKEFDEQATFSTRTKEQRTRRDARYSINNIYNVNSTVAVSGYPPARRPLARGFRAPAAGRSILSTYFAEC